MLTTSSQPEAPLPSLSPAPSTSTTPGSIGSLVRLFSPSDNQEKQEQRVVYDAAQTVER